MCRSFQDQTYYVTIIPQKTSSVAQENFGGFKKDDHKEELVNQISGLNSPSTLKLDSTD